MLATFAITLAVLHISNAEHKFSSTVFPFPNRRFLAEPSFDNTTLYYATCDHPPKQCTLVRAINLSSKTPKTKECNINLKADVHPIVVFRGNKAILVTKESLMLKTTTVQMFSCETVETEVFQISEKWKDIQLYRKFLDVVVFDSGFELVIKELPQLCNESPLVNKYCGFSFDDKGKRVEGPYVWPKVMYDDINVVSPIMTDASGKGYVFVHRTASPFFLNANSSLIGIQADRRGGPTYVKLWGPEKISSDLLIGGHSTANNFNGACYLLNSTVKCWQNDAEGGLKMSNEFSFKTPQDLWSLSVHNLPEGGFLILIITCPNRTCSGVDDHYHFLKIDNQAHITGHAEIDLQKSECSAGNFSISTKTFVDQQGLYCSSILCHNFPKGEDQLEIRTDCCSDNDFSKDVLWVL